MGVIRSSTMRWIRVMMKIPSEEEFFRLYVVVNGILREPNITKERAGPNMVNFEQEIRDGAFDSDVPPLKVIL